MSWIKSFQALGDHPKTKRAARLLGVSKPTMVGHLHYLWWWAVSYAEDGSLAGYSPEDVADVALWDRAPAEFIAALLDCGVNGRAGFLERDEDGSLWIHDWEEYAGKLVERRATERDRQRNKRADIPLPLEDVAATLVQQPANVAPLARGREAEAEESRVDKKQSRAESSANKIAAAAVPENLKSFDAVLRPFDGYSPSENFFATVDERYSHLPLKEEAVKATEWLCAHQKRKCTTLFMLKWLGNAAAGYAARATPTPPPRPADAGRNYKSWDEVERERRIERERSAGARGPGQPIDTVPPPGAAGPADSVARIDGPDGGRPQRPAALGVAGGRRGVASDAGWGVGA